MLPEHRTQALRCEPTSGNFSKFIALCATGKETEALTIYHKLASAYATHSLLFSSEFLLEWLAPSPSGRLSSIMGLLGCEQVKILLYIRNPLEHAISSYAQFTSRRLPQANNSVASLGDYIGRVYNIPGQVLRLVTDLKASSDADFTIINYSNLTRPISAGFFEWLLGEHTTLESPVKPKTPRINRSLSRSEIEVARLLASKNIPPSIVTDRWLGLEPSPNDRPLSTTLDSAKALYQRLGPTLSQINKTLPASEHYQLMTEHDLAASDLVTSSETLDSSASDLTIRSPQIEILVEELLRYGFRKGISRPRTD